MTEQERLAKNKQISQTKRETIDRHNHMSVKTFDVKIQENQLSTSQKEALNTIFLEQKWLKNYILNWCEQSEENKISKFDTKIKEITKKDKDMNDVSVTLKYLSAQSKQCLKSRMISNIKTLHTLKSKGLQKCGKLKFSKEETIIDLKQYCSSHKIISSKRINAAGCFLPLSENTLIDKKLGTRHRAALGISERTDAVALVVSEETGVISYTKGGNIHRYIDSRSLRELLESVFSVNKEEGGWFVRLENQIRSFLRSEKDKNDFEQ